MIILFAISSSLIILGFLIMFFIEKYKENKRLNDLNLNIMNDWQIALNKYIKTDFFDLINK